MNGIHYPREFELVNKDGSLMRLRTDNGWILIYREKYISFDKMVSCAVAMIEKIDPEHSWDHLEPVK